MGAFEPNQAEGYIRRVVRLELGRPFAFHILRAFPSVCIDTHRM